MNKNKLLRVMMLLSLLAPTAGSVTVLAQDALPEVNQATATSTDDVTSTDSDSQKEKDPNVTTEDQTNHVSSDDTSAKSDVLNPAEPTRPELEDQTDQVTTPNATIPIKIKDKTSLLAVKSHLKHLRKTLFPLALLHKFRQL